MVRKQTAATPVIEVKSPTSEVEKQTAGLIVEAKSALVITNADQCRTASIALGRVQQMRRWVEGVFKAARKPLNEARTKIIAEETKFVTPLENLERQLTKGIQDFRKVEAEQRAKAVEEERRRREEDARREQEQRATELRQAAAAAPSKKVARLLETQATTLETAQPIIDEVIESDAPELLSDGQHERKTYHAAVQSKEKLVLQIAAQIIITKHGAPPEIVGWLAQFKPNAQARMDLIQPHMVELNKLARALKLDLDLQGVVAEEDATIVTRS